MYRSQSIRGVSSERIRDGAERLACHGPINDEYFEVRTVLDDAYKGLLQSFEADAAGSTSVVTRKVDALRPPSQTRRLFRRIGCGGGENVAERCQFYRVVEEETSKEEFGA